MATAAFIKSPAQAAADTRPPPASVLTAPVEKKVLSETVIARGKVAASQQLDVSGDGVGEKDSGRSVVTKVSAEAGRSLQMGQLLLEISGRPVFVLKGDIPAYRDLRPGSTGKDVSQLQRALAELGYLSGNDRAGTFGAGTEHAVARFYRDRGSVPATGQTDTGPAPKDGAADGEAAGRSAGADAAASPPVIVPMSEVVYVRTEPAYIEQVLAHVGDDAQGDLISISAGTLIVNGSVGPEARDLVKPGQKVSIASEVTGSRAAGTVESVAAKPAKPQKDTGQAGGDTYAVRVKPAGRLPADLTGEDVRLTITAASSGKPVLAVPTSAVSAGEDGRTTVTVLRGRKELRVAVETGMAADGYVQVTPGTHSGLAVGDRVIVGVDEQRTVKGR